jgi:RNA polymerase-associated protein RTF1
LDAGEGQFFMTDQYVVASYGTLNKEYPFNACSDTKFSEDEFHRRVQNLDSASMKLTTSSFLTNKCKDINQFLQAPRTSAEISQKLANQSRLAHLNTSSIAPAVGQNTLQRDLALHKRNLDNRKLNEEQVRKALIADRRRRIQFAETNARKAKEEEERKKKAEEAELWGGDDDADDTTPAADAKAKPVSKYVHRDYKNGLNDFTRVKTDDEIIASMDLGIDIDIDI